MQGSQKRYLVSEAPRPQQDQSKSRHVVFSFLDGRSQHVFASSIGCKQTAALAGVRVCGTRLACARRAGTAISGPAAGPHPATTSTIAAGVCLSKRVAPALQPPRPHPHPHPHPRAAPLALSMGNQPSRSNTPTSSPHSPSVTSSHGHPPNARRRESIQALSTKASIAPPSASLESAAALNSSAHPHTHARARSQTIASSTTAQVASTLRAAHDTMGAEQSRQKGPVAPIREATPPKPIAAPPSLDQRRPAPSPKTRPVDVPSAPRDDALASRTAQASSIEPADASQEGYIVPSSHFSRPPRLPLPIEEEPHTPGSPIISPADLTGPIDHGEIEGPLPRRSSMLSSTAADDDDLGDEFKGPQGQPTVPTLIEWEGPGERVYVTGTFAGWNRKYRLHRK